MAINWTDHNSRRTTMPFILNRRLFTDKTQTKILEDGDPAAAFLIGGEGTTLPDDIVKKYKLDESHRLKEEEVKTETADGAEKALTEADGVEEDDAQEAEEVDLESMSKAELQVYADEQGVEYKTSWSKQQIIEALQAE